MIVGLHEVPHEPDVTAGVRHLLVEGDREFVPPLSSRADTGTLLAADDGPDNAGYADAMAEEDWLVAWEGADVVGVLSSLGAPGGANLTTIIVSAAFRGGGVGTRLYTALELLAIKRGLGTLGTRAWSTNRSHLQLLVSRGFSESGGEVDERGAGLDTVYQRKDLTRRGDILVRRGLHPA